MLSINAHLQPNELLASWRSQTGRLYLSATEVPSLRERVAVRIRLGGRAHTATIQGEVCSVLRGRALHRIEVAPDFQSLKAMQLLLAVARGEPVRYQDRAPRFLVRLPVVVASDTWAFLMSTLSISETGCGLAWAGPQPEVGQSIRVRLLAGSRSTEVEGVVRWTSKPARNAGVSVMLGRSARFTWGGLLAEAERLGAPRA
jgi:PilZ domain